jgi:DNA invertase Pin-like site-specific DNA recombinase
MAINGGPHRAVIYARISDDREGRGLGVERQLTDCRELAQRRDFTVIGEFVDNDISAYSRKVRKGWRELWESIGNGRADVVVAYSTSRLYRRVADLDAIISDIESNHVQIATVVAGDIDLNTAASRTVARVLASIDQGEVEQVRERTARKHRDLAERGLPGPGWRAWGYERIATDHGKDYRVIPHEADTIRHCVSGILAGSTLYGLVTWLNENGERTPQGKPWQANTLKTALRNPTLAAWRVWRTQTERANDEQGQRIKGTWAPIISEAEHIKVCARLPLRSANEPRSVNLLSGIAYCGKCGASLRHHNASKRADGRGTDPEMYRCPNHIALPNGGLSCAGLGISAKPLLGYVSTAVLERLRSIPLGQPTDIPESDTRAVAEIAELQRQRTEFAGSTVELIQSGFKPSDIGNTLADFDRKIAEAERSIQRVVETDEDRLWREYASDLLAANPPTEATVFELSDDAYQREVLKHLVEKITVNPANRSRSNKVQVTPLFERVEITWRV